MPDIVLADAKKPDNLETYRSTLNSYEYRLFVNNYTPVGSMVSGDFSEPPGGEGGYAPLTPVFASPILNAGNDAEVEAPVLTWVFDHGGGDFTIYGYWVTDPGDSDAVVYAQRASVPLAVTVAGQTFSVVPRYTRGTA